MFFVNLFSSNQQVYFNKIFDNSYDLNCQLIPKRLFLMIENLSMNILFDKKLKSKSKSQLQHMRKLSLIGLIILYYKDKDNKKLKNLNQILKTYLQCQDSYVKKINDNKIIKAIQIIAQLLYALTLPHFDKENSQQSANVHVIQQIKTFKVQDQELINRVSYCLDKINIIFKIINDVAYLGRYCKDKGKKSLQNFLQVVALFIKMFYMFIKNAATKILLDPNKYLTCQNKKKLFYDLMQIIIPKINDKMAYLFLSKYFMICEKIGLKLLRQQQLFGQLKENYQNFIKQFNQSQLKSSHQIKHNYHKHTLKQLLLITHPQVEDNQQQIPQILRTMMDMEEQITYLQRFHLLKDDNQNDQLQNINTKSVHNKQNKNKKRYIETYQDDLEDQKDQELSSSKYCQRKQFKITNNYKQQDLNLTQPTNKQTINYRQQFQKINIYD